jgi:hypothetical protein
MVQGRASRAARAKLCQSIWDIVSDAFRRNAPRRQRAQAAFDFTPNFFRIISSGQNRENPL